MIPPLVLLALLITTAAITLASELELCPLPHDAAARYARDLALPHVKPETFEGIVVRRGLEYAARGDRSMKLDLYLPPQAEENKVPCVVVIRGGGFKAADRSGFAPLAAYFAANGFAAACIDYRGRPNHEFIDTIADTKAAVCCIRAAGSLYGIDTDRIAAFGQSAGGHLALMLAVSADLPELEGHGGRQEVSSRVQAAVSWSGVFDFVSRLKEGGHQKKDREKKRRTIGEWVGEPFDVASEKWRTASPFYHLSPGAAPALFVHCKGDPVAPVEQSLQMHKSLRRHAPTSRLLLLDGTRHGISRIPELNRKAWAATFEFLTDVL